IPQGSNRVQQNLGVAARRFRARKKCLLVTVTHRYFQAWGTEERSPWRPRGKAVVWGNAVSLIARGNGWKGRFPAPEKIFPERGPFRRKLRLVPQSRIKVPPR